MNLTKEQEEKIIKLYTEEKRGQSYCSKQVLKMNRPDIVKKVLKKYGVKIRNFKEAAVLNNKNRIKYTSKNINFFDNQSSDMAWIMGFIAADGTIRKDSNEIKIGLSIKDYDVLEKIKKTINLDEPIKTYTTKNGYDCCRLRWTCEEHKKALRDYSIVPNKTFVLQPPFKLDKKYWIDYIRGYFDGDGSVNLIHNKGSISLRWQVCSATKCIIDFIVSYFEEEYGIPKVKIQERKGRHTLYYIQYSTKASKKIFSLLYKENSLFCERKYNNFCKILGSIQ